jgi:hypothetical protein
VVSIVFWGVPRTLGAQAVANFIPEPTARTCGISAGQAVKASEANALALLKQSVSSMDAKGLYGGTKKFNISGVLSDFDRVQKASTQIGSFAFQEDHTVSNGNYNHEFVVNGVSRGVTRVNGVINRQPNDSDNSDAVGKLAFVPKSYIFPLALLADDVVNPAISVYFVSERPGLPPNKSLASLRHVRVINRADAKTARYEVEDWYIDPKTFLPILVGHQLPTLGNSPTCVEVYTGYSAYQSISGSLVPTAISTHRGGPKVRTTTIQTLNY